MTKDDRSEMTSCYRASTSVSTIVILLRPARIKAFEQDVIANLSSAELVTGSAGEDNKVRETRRLSLRHRTWEGACVRLTIDRIMNCQGAERAPPRRERAAIARVKNPICPCRGVKAHRGVK